MEMLFKFDVCAVLNLIHGETNADSIASFVKADASEGSFNILSSESFAHSFIISGVCFVDGVKDSHGSSVAVDEECAGVSLERSFVLFNSFDVEGVCGSVFRTCGINAFCKFARNFYECVVFHAVIRDEGDVDLFFAHLSNDFGSFGVVSAEDNRFSA